MTITIITHRMLSMNANRLPAVVAADFAIGAETIIGCTLSHSRPAAPVRLEQILTISRYRVEDRGDSAALTHYPNRRMDTTRGCRRNAQPSRYAHVGNVRQETVTSETEPTRSAKSRWQCTFERRRRHLQPTADGHREPQY